MQKSKAKITNQNSKARLQKLRKEIKQTQKNAWFFDDYFKRYPENRSVGGFLSTGKYFFIFPNPNKPKRGDINRKNTELDKFFRMLKELKIKNAHLTDFLKIPLKREEAGKYWTNRNNFRLSNKLLGKEIEILEREINIVRPLEIIIVGRSYVDKIKPIIGKITKQKIKIDWIFHYSCYVSNKWEKIKKQLEEIKKENKYGSK